MARVWLDSPGKRAIVVEVPGGRAIGVQGRWAYDDLSRLLHGAVASMSVEVGGGVAGRRGVDLDALRRELPAKATVTAFKAVLELP